MKWMWKTGQNAALMKKYGIANPDYPVVPPPKNLRIGVDRDADNNVIGPGAHPDEGFLVAVRDDAVSVRPAKLRRPSWSEPSA